MTHNQTLLVALSHPDDEIGCVGTIAAHRAAGIRVVILFLTRGQMTESLGPLTAAEIGEARAGHAKEVASLLGAELLFLDFADTEVEYSPAASRVVARTIAEVKPGAVLTWGQAWVRGMRHPDHMATGEIVRAGITLARMKRAVEPIEPYRGAAPVFTIRDRHSTLPAAAIDVTPHVPVVLEVAKYYRERVGWPEEAWLRTRLQRAGYAWGVEAAEEFDAWESAAGLRPSLLGSQLAI